MDTERCLWWCGILRDAGDWFFFPAILARWATPSKASAKRAILTYVVKSDLFSLMMHSALQKNIALLRGQLLNDDEIMASRDPMRRMAMLAFFDTALPIGMRWEGLRNDVKQMASSSLYDMDQMRIPALVIHGTADPVLPFAAASQPPAGFLTRSYFR